MQQDLNTVYRRAFASASLSPTLAARLSCPLLLAVGDRWADARDRVLFVGQETRGWAWVSGTYYSWPYPPLRSFADFMMYDSRFAQIWR